MRRNRYHREVDGALLDIAEVGAQMGRLKEASRSRSFVAKSPVVMRQRPSLTPGSSSENSVS